MMGGELTERLRFITVPNESLRRVSTCKLEGRIELTRARTSRR